jgi:hypothetical protein
LERSEAGGSIVYEFIPDGSTGVKFWATIVFQAFEFIQGYKGHFLELGEYNHLI